MTCGVRNPGTDGIYVRSPIASATSDTPSDEGRRPRDRSLPARTPTRARDRFCAALRSFAVLSDGGGIADCLDGLARLTAAAGDARRGTPPRRRTAIRETRG